LGIFDEGEGDGEDTAPPISEIDKYLALPQQRALLPCGQEACPLEWWRGYANTLPHLAKMARQFLALPASSAGPERIFHAAGRMHDDMKKRTLDTTLEHTLNVYANT
jgi:hypothetical protein